MEMLDAVILAAGRLRASEGACAGNQIKALVRIGGVTLLQVVLDAARGVTRVRRTVVVGPSAARASVRGVDGWIDEKKSGEENVLAAVAAAGTRRVLLCASDIPFVSAAALDDFLSRVPADADFAYPVFERGEFLAIFPGGRSQFAQVGKAAWTGGSVCVLNAALALANERLIRRTFNARRSQFAMASLLGVAMLARHAFGTLEIEDIVARVGRLTGGKAFAIRGAPPSLAMDCDSLADVEYARERVPSLVHGA